METELIIQNLDAINITNEKIVIHFKIQSYETNFL